MRPFRVKERSLLLDFLLKNLAPLKPTKVKQILKYGSVSVNGRITTSHRHALKAGDTIQILTEKNAAAERVKSRLEFPIVYEDDSLVVINKPAGLLAMGTEKEKEETAYFKLTAYMRAKSKDGRGRVFIVHRLDRDTSGLMVFAKNPEVKHLLQEGWNNVLKKYHAVCEGVPEPKTGKIESYLVEDSFKRVYSKQSASYDAKYAVTHYAVLKHNRHYAFLDITLETGRKNQIRVHLSDIGCPVAGDAKYDAHTNPIGRMALHAYRLSFRHPVTGEAKSFTLNTPDSFKELVS